MTTPGDDVRIEQVEVLHDGFGMLRRTTFAYRSPDGDWRERRVETYERGQGVAALLHDPGTGNVLLVRQFRLPAFLLGVPPVLFEAPAGTVEEGDADAAIRREILEETGVRATALERVLEVLPSPGILAEQLVLYIGRYDEAAPRDAPSGGGEFEDEDVTAVEVPFEQALEMVERGEIVDGKTILLLYHARLRGLI
jgi:nudix-type nucleoside diphosphatase (YffH/AdpP family)